MLVSDEVSCFLFHYSMTFPTTVIPNLTLSINRNMFPENLVQACFQQVGFFVVVIHSCSIFYLHLSCILMIYSM